VPGSPARRYGCRTFAAGDRTAAVVSQPAAPSDTQPLPPDQDPSPGRIQVSGSIATDTRWSAATVAVVGDVRVEDGVTLSIAPGVRVEFQGHYRLDVAGTLHAVGTPQRRILFTSAEPGLFAIDRSTLGCWNGIHFEGTRATNAASHLAWCVLEYSKATGTENRPYPYAGGALSVVDFSKLTVESCILRHNLAQYGGALFLYRNAAPRILGNLIVDNHALTNAAALYCGYSQPMLVNNTIAANSIHNAAAPFEETCAILCFLSKPLLVNNILHDNAAVVPVAHGQLWGGKAYYVRNNAIERYPAIGGNFPHEPLFVDPQGGDWRLRWGSPCVDAGTDPGPVAPSRASDLAGSPLPVDGDLDRVEQVDIGALELVPLALRGRPVVGSRIALELLGPVGASARLYATRGGTLPVPLRTRYGELDLDPQRLLPLGLTVTSGGPAALIPLALPPDPGAVGSSFAFQALVDPVSPLSGPAWTNALEVTLQAGPP